MFALLAQPDLAAIDSVLDRPEFLGSILSVCVSTASGELLYGRNTQLRLMPASNQKLLSVAYALHRLGPEFVPVTKFWKEGSTVYVESNGDPSMTYDRLVAVRKALKLKKVSKVLVKQAYRPGYGPGWEWDDLPNRYAPSITAFSYDTASFELWGDANKFWLKNGDLGIKMSWNPNESQPNEFNLQTRMLKIHASKPKTATKIEAFAQPNPDHMAARVLGGPFYLTNQVPNRQPDFLSKGLPLGEIAAACLVPSDNYMAESLLMMAAASESPLTAKAYIDASKRLKAFLTDVVKLDAAEADPFDGSGLSRHNIVTTSGIAKLLLWAREQPWSEAWSNALASPGHGTLRNRLKDVPFRGKTGTLNKVSSLSGYVTTKGGNELVVSILMNHYVNGDSAARKAQDEIIGVLAAYDRSGPKNAAAKDYVRPFSYAIYRSSDVDRLFGPAIDGHAPQIGPDY